MATDGRDLAPPAIFQPTTSRLLLPAGISSLSPPVCILPVFKPHNKIFRLLCVGLADHRRRTEKITSADNLTSGPNSRSGFEEQQHRVPLACRTRVDVRHDKDAGVLPADEFPVSQSGSCHLTLENKEETSRQIAQVLSRGGACRTRKQ